MFKVEANLLRIVGRIAVLAFLLWLQAAKFFHIIICFRPQSYYLSTDFQRKLLLLIVLLAKIAIFACYFV